jgi:catechol 2,3-dioxygenase-like lactoylglutathione lyase family enzyme
MYLEHVNLSVANLEQSLAFYRQLFDWDVRWRGFTTSGQPAAHVGDERTYLALFEALEPTPAELDYEHVGLNHFGFVVDDLDAFRNRLKELGVEPHMEQDYEPGVRLYFTDPNGVEIELVQYAAAAAT